jgi:hypothetical protein
MAIFRYKTKEENEGRTQHRQQAQFVSAGAARLFWGLLGPGVLVGC